MVSNNNADFFFKLARENHLKGKLELAKNLYKQILDQNENDYNANFLLGVLFIQQNKPSDSINYSRKAVEIYPNNKSLNNLGVAFQLLNYFNDAELHFKKAIKFNPKDIDAYTNLMNLYERSNEYIKLNYYIKEAEKNFKNNLDINLLKAKYFYAKEKFDKAIDILESFYFNEKNSKKEKTRSNLLAKCYDKKNNIDKAFKNFQKCNDISFKLKSKDTDKNKYLKIIKIRNKFFSNTNFRSKPFKKEESINFNPIFLVGFPRSGTTLLDTILSSHQKIEVIEEKSLLRKSIFSVIKDDIKILKKFDEIEYKDIEKIREKYFFTLKSYIKNYDVSKIYIDKLPLNIIHIGEIIKIFPNSKFLISIRHPYDCVLSAFMQDFQINNSMSNFLKLDDSAHLYNEVMKLWFVYKSKLNFNYMEVKYENIILNFEKQIKAVIEFLGLSWQNELLDYQTTAKKKDMIFTPSYNQVIKPIYSQSMNRWVRYEKYFKDINYILEPWVKKFNYE